MVCQVQSKPESVSLNIQQALTISWDDTVIPYQETGQFFTYKPDPIINDIHPRVTIRRYEINLTFNTCNSLLDLFHNSAEAFQKLQNIDLHRSRSIVNQIEQEHRHSDQFYPFLLQFHGTLQMPEYFQDPISLLFIL